METITLKIKVNGVVKNIEISTDELLKIFKDKTISKQLSLFTNKPVKKGMSPEETTKMNLICTDICTYLTEMGFDRFPRKISFERAKSVYVLIQELKSKSHQLIKVYFQKNNTQSLETIEDYRKFFECYDGYNGVGCSAWQLYPAFDILVDTEFEHDGDGETLAEIEEFCRASINRATFKLKSQYWLHYFGAFN